MPSFACCAMQSAYALLMIRQRTRLLQAVPEPKAGLMVENLLGRLQQGLASVLGVLENYSTAFEALGGMRGERGPLLG